MATKAGGAYIEVRADSKKLPGDLDVAHSKVASAAKRMEDSLTTAAKRAGIAIAAAFAVVAYKTASLVKESALFAARFETLDVVMKQVGKNAGYTAEQMDSYDIALRKTGISMIESRNSLAKMAQAQLDLSKATALGRIAQDAAVIGNINSSEAFGRMIDGIQRGSGIILKTIGINVQFEQSYKKVAEETGRAVKSFTESEKAVIRQNAVIEYGSRIAGTYEAAMTTAGKKLSSFTRYVEDFKVKMGLAFGPATVMLVDAATLAMKQLQEEISKPEAQAAMQAFASNLAEAVILLGKDLPSKIGAITDKLEGIWKVISYDPAILEWGLIGLALGGRKGALLMASLAHMTTWTENLGKALGLVSAGVLDISDVANANFKELQALINNFEMPTELGGLELQAKKYREEIENLRRETEGQIFWPRGSKEALVETEKKLREIQDRIAGIKQGKFVEGLITFKMPSIPSAPSISEPESKVIALSEEQIKAMQEQENFAIKMANAEAQRMREREQLGFDILESFRTAKMTETELALEALDKQFLAYDNFVQDKTALDQLYVREYEKIMATANAEKLAAQADFNQQYAEMGKSQFDLEREQLDRQVKIWEEAEISKDRISKLYSDKSIKIAQAEQQAKLSMYQNAAGGIANTFQQIAQAGGKQSKKAFEVYKAFSLVEAGISGYKAVLQAMAAYPPPWSFIMAGIAAAAAAVQIGLIASSQPPSYDQGGISEAEGMYRTGPIREAHIPIPSGGKIPVKVESNQQKPPVQIILNNPVFQDLETQRQVMAQIASVIAAQVAPGAIIENYENDGQIRQMVRGGM